MIKDVAAEETRLTGLRLGSLSQKLVSAAPCAVMQLAIVEGLRKDDPTATIKSMKIKGDGFHTWTEGQIATFETKHPLGTRARLAFALLLYTAQRRGDVIQMGRRHVSAGVLRVRQQKTGMNLEIPLHSALQAAMDAGPTGDLTFLVTRRARRSRRPGSAAGFIQVAWMLVLTACSAHGLRKAASRHLAEAGSRLTRSCRSPATRR